MKRNHRQLMPLLFIFCISLIFNGCKAGSSAVPPGRYDSNTGTLSDTQAEVTVHFIDVGQGDSILIQSGEENMLIDAGLYNIGDVVPDYLHNLGIDKLDWLIATHPHSDHIGGMDKVIKNFGISHMMMPQKEHTSPSFENLLDAIEEKDLTITKPVVGDTYTLGSCTFTILAPVCDYGDEINNWSIAIRLVCGDTAFLLAGDAEYEAEADICRTGLDLSANVLKLGHHGSSTSSSDQFLDAVSPSAAIICCAKNNDYGHPHRETMAKLKALGIDVYRTDEDGTIIITSDGSDLSFETDGNFPETGDEDQIIVHRTRKGHSYHRADCDGLSRSDFPLTLKEAKDMGLKPCPNCQPPK